jgi:cytochrome d ubiquinol oxidase subunit II
MPSSTSSDFDLTIANTSSSDYTLTVMTIVAVILVPVVLLYQSWTYWVFRKRVSPSDFDPELRNPLDMIREDKDDAPAEA